MIKTIDIREFAGVWSNADPEDLGAEWAGELVNLRPVNGKLVKTRGMGLRADVPALPLEIHNLATYIEANVPYGFYYMAPRVGADGRLQVYFWYDSGTYWGSMDIADLNIHQNPGRNPIVQAGGIIRFLPGNIGEVDGTEAKGMWHGWIDRRLFDGLHPTFALHRVYTTEIERPSLNWTVTGHVFKDSGFASGDSYYYLFSNIYDGIQESLLGDNPSKWTVSAAHEFPRLTSKPFNPDACNYRITGMKVYRSRYNSATGVREPYKRIQVIDFLRGADAAPCGANGLYRYDNMVAIPALEAETFNDTKAYTVSIDGGAYVDIDNPGSGTEFFHFHFTSFLVIDPKWNVKWAVKEDGVAWKSGTSGGYCSHNDLAVIGTELPEDTYTNGVLIANSEFRNGREYTGIEMNAGKVLRLRGVISGQSNEEWRVLSQKEGTYLAEAGTDDNVVYTFFDAALADGAEHPLYKDGEEKSIKVNGRFARIISGRLWQGDIVLDPGGKNEIHRGWVSFSELGQYDVNPVSNVLYMEDREGGDIEGIAEVFGCPVVLKKHAIIFINIRTDLNDPETWTVKESAHNIGSLARDGYVEANGDLYVCWSDAIYRLRPNNLAETDSTPTERLRVTGPIEDVYQALTSAQREAIKATFDPSRGEIVYTLGSEIWALNVDTGNWRKVVSSGTVDLFATDENGQVLAYDRAAASIRTLDPSTPEAAGVRYRKFFRISPTRKETVREIEVTYRSGSPLTVNIYADGASGADWSGTLPVSEVMDAVQLYPRFPAKTITVEIISGADLKEVEIMRVKIEHD